MLGCGCSTVSVAGYWGQCVVSAGEWLNGLIGVIIISLSPLRTPCSLPGWSTSWNEMRLLQLQSLCYCQGRNSRKSALCSCVELTAWAARLTTGLQQNNLLQNNFHSLDLSHSIALLGKTNWPFAAGNHMVGHTSPSSDSSFISLLSSMVLSNHMIASYKGPIVRWAQQMFAWEVTGLLSHHILPLGKTPPPPPTTTSVSGHTILLHPVMWYRNLAKHYGPSEYKYRFLISNQPCLQGPQSFPFVLVSSTGVGCWKKICVWCDNLKHTH